MFGLVPKDEKNGEKTQFSFFCLMLKEREQNLGAGPLFDADEKLTKNTKQLLPFATPPPINSSPRFLDEIKHSKIHDHT
jgi:hypothetical protein